MACAFRLGENEVVFEANSCHLAVYVIAGSACASAKLQKLLFKHALVAARESKSTVLYYKQTAPSTVDDITAILDELNLLYDNSLTSTTMAALRRIRFHYDEQAGTALSKLSDTVSNMHHLPPPDVIVVERLNGLYTQTAEGSNPDNQSLYIHPLAAAMAVLTDCAADVVSRRKRCVDAVPILVGLDTTAESDTAMLVDTLRLLDCAVGAYHLKQGEKDAWYLLHIDGGKKINLQNF